MGIITDILKDIPLSAILRDRLSDQEKKMALLETENAFLKTENLTLKNQNSNLNRVVEELRKKIEGNEQQHNKEISELTEKYNKAISKMRHGKDDPGWDAFT